MVPPKRLLIRTHLRCTCFRFRDWAFLVGVWLGDHVVMTFGGTIVCWGLIFVDSSHSAPPVIGSE